MNLDSHEWLQAGWHWLLPCAFLPSSMRWLTQHPFAAGLACSVVTLGAVWHSAAWLQERERTRWAVAR